MSDIKSKVCSKCNKDKPLEEYNKNKTGRFGRLSFCKACKSEYDKRPDQRQRRLEYARERGYTEADHNYYYKRRIEQPEWYLYSSAKRRAKKRGVEFDIVVDDIFIPTHCPILGIELSFEGGVPGKASDFSPSLDRIDSTKGYIEGNIAVISYRANVIKNNGTIEEHRRIADWMEGLL